jgi:hypothetical protein
MHRHLVVSAHINDELQQVVAGLAAIENRCGAALVLHASLASRHLAVVASRSSVSRVRCAFSTETLARAFVSSRRSAGRKGPRRGQCAGSRAGCATRGWPRSTRRRSLATHSSIRSSIRLSVEPSSAISSFPLVRDSLRPRIGGRDRRGLPSHPLDRSQRAGQASQAPSEMSNSPADPAMASVAASWTSASWRSCKDVPTATTSRPWRATTGTARILVTLAMPRTVLSYSVTRRSNRAPAGESSRDRAMSGVDRSTRPEASSICVNTSTFSISFRPDVHLRRPVILDAGDQQGSARVQVRCRARPGVRRAWHEIMPACTCRTRSRAGSGNQ